MSGLEDRDWDLLEATQDSLREHMAMARDLKQKLEKCKEVLRFYAEEPWEWDKMVATEIELDQGTKARTLLKELEDL